MDTVNIRHCLNLSWSKVILTGLFFWNLCSLVQAQDIRIKRVYLQDYDDKPVHYGFYFAAPNTRFNIRYSENFVNADTTLRIYSPKRTGFRVGFILNGFLTDRIDVRLTPAVSLYGREIIFDGQSGTSRTLTRESTWLEFPLLLKYKSERRHNSRMYLVAGGTFGVETNVRRREVLGATRLSTNTTDFQIEYGIGFEQFFEFFKFSPELRFAHGIPNLFQQTPATANSSIRRLTSHAVTIYLNFE
ncbi:porin family protein [Nibrella saemangeumensis]|uniref:Porin family protein n=1 Tax=Nibrella saemangeumensis TaxID=1084526 RepID=A0ABP8N3H2_9BACT